LFACFFKKNQFFLLHYIMSKWSKYPPYNSDFGKNIMNGICDENNEDMEKSCSEFYSICNTNSIANDSTDNMDIDEPNGDSTGYTGQEDNKMDVDEQPDEMDVEDDSTGYMGQEDNNTDIDESNGVSNKMDVKDDSYEEEPAIVQPAVVQPNSASDEMDVEDDSHEGEPSEGEPGEEEPGEEEEGEGDSEKMNESGGKSRRRRRKSRKSKGGKKSKRKSKKRKSKKSKRKSKGGKKSKRTRRRK
jgi:hypothetical protein